MGEIKIEICACVVRTTGEHAVTSLQGRNAPQALYTYIYYLYDCVNAQEPTARHKSKLLLIVARACKLLYAAAYWCMR